MTAETNRDITGSLAGFASGLTLDSMSAEVRERTKLLLLDAVGSAMTGWSSPETSKIYSAVFSAFGEGESTVIGGGKASLGGAAMLNGYLITARSICDMHQPTLSHITPVVVPATLALGERADVDGATLLAALAAGMESDVRIGLGLDYPEFRSRGWHTPGVAGPVGAAIGGGRALGLDALRIERAMGIAYSQAGGTFASFGTPTIKFHQARAAWAGLMAVVLEEQGFEGPMSALTADDGGMYSTYADGGLADLANEGLGEVWKLHDITVRLWPAAAALQSILTIVDEGDVPEVADIESVRVSLPPANYDMHAEMGWGTTFQATLSARYVTSVALTHRRFWLDQLEGDGLNDAAIGDFARNRVDVAKDETLPEGGVELLVTTQSGEEIVSRCESPKGSPGNPPTWEDVAAKLERAVGDRLTPEQGGRIIDTVGDLENLSSVQELTRSLRA